MLTARGSMLVVIAAIGMIAAAVVLVLAMLLGRLKPELVKDPMLAVVRGQI